jgi:hypothetical protein
MLWWSYLSQVGRVGGAAVPNVDLLAIKEI